MKIIQIQLCEEMVERILNNAIFYILHALLGNAHSFLMVTVKDICLFTYSRVHVSSHFSNCFHKKLSILGKNRQVCLIEFVYISKV